jgi:hypothetical protein
MADACVFLMEHNIYDGIYNLGTGKTSPSANWPKP